MKHDVAMDYEMLFPAEQLLIDAMISTLVKKEQKITLCEAELGRELRLRDEEKLGS